MPQQDRSVMEVPRIENWFLIMSSHGILRMETMSAMFRSRTQKCGRLEKRVQGPACLFAEINPMIEVGKYGVVIGS
jgi:hypothetical protein